MTDFMAEMHQIRFRGPQTPLRELTALPRLPSWIWGPLRGRGGAGLGRGGKGEGKGREGKWRGGKGRAPKLLLNQSPSEPCYATGKKVKGQLVLRQIYATVCYSIERVTL